MKEEAAMLSRLILPKIIKVKLVVMSRWQGISHLCQGEVGNTYRREGREEKRVG